MKIKVCGMTSLNQIHQLEDLGVDFAGLIFYPKSPRYVETHGLKAEAVKRAGLKIIKVGVFVNASYDEIRKTIDEYGLDMVQLHGYETPFECARISDYIHTIKAFRFSENDHVEWMIKDYYASADMFLFDTGVNIPKTNSENFGGTGRKFDWNRLKGLDINKSYFLSGGIEPGDAPLISDFLQQPVAKNLFVIDVNSRFETSPGVKDLEKLTSFMKDLNLLK